MTEADLADKGLLVVVSGFSGAGKGSIMKRILQKYDNYALSISATTRDPRPGEMDGQDYFYKTQKQFEKMIDKDELIEYASYQGNYYGTPRAYVERMLDEGKNVILEIDVQGGEHIRKLFPDVVRIFVTAPSAEELKRRLIGRGTETALKVKGRLIRAVVEMRYIPDYEYLLVNDDLEEATQRLYSIVTAERMKTKRCGRFISDLKDEFDQVLLEPIE